MRVVATRIEQDGTMQRRVVDTAHCADGPQWEDLACRALAAPPPYRPVPGSPIYHVSLDGDRQVLVAEQDLGGALLDLVTAVLAMGEQAVFVERDIGHALMTVHRWSPRSGYTQARRQ